MTKVPTVTLNNGVQMPQLGFGVYLQTDPEECERSVLEAISAGYRLIDTAANYGNEEAVGRAIARSGIPREELFIATKLQPQDGTYEGTQVAFQASLDKLGLDYVDLYLQHMPFNDIYGAWRAMAEFTQDGRARAIGVCNYSAERLQDFVLNVEIIPAVNQIEFHPFSQQVTAKAVMDEYGIKLNAWGPFAQGREGLLADATLTKVARNRGRSVAQVVLRWNIQRGVIPIPKSSQPERIAANFDIFDFELSNEEMGMIDALDQDKSRMKSPIPPQLIKYVLSEANYTL